MKFNPTVSGGEAVAPKTGYPAMFPITVLSCLLRRPCLLHRGSSLEVGNSTSLPGWLPHCQKAQVCEGSAGLQLDGQAEVAKAWAARSW